MRAALPQGEPLAQETLAPSEYRRRGYRHKAHRHSRRVVLLRRLLPTIGIMLVLLIATWPRLAPLWERIQAGFPAIDLRDAQELRMLNPRYAGIDRHGRPFIVTAAVGRQVPQHQDLMSLQMPDARLKTNSGATIAMTAATGIYQQQTQLLDLFGNVRLVHQNGTEFTTERARIEGAHETAQGDEPVSGHGPSGSIKAQGFRVLDKGDRILFTGKSDALFRSAAPGPGKAAPAGLPAPVAAAAAQAEAEARPALAAETGRNRKAAAPHAAAGHHNHAQEHMPAAPHRAGAMSAAAAGPR
jgi:lipopolysaccharide export system protein LptC